MLKIDRRNREKLLNLLVKYFIYSCNYVIFFMNLLKVENVMNKRKLNLYKSL